MKATIVAIGDELLQGAVVNDNGAYLARAFNNLGFVVTSHPILSDEPKALKAGLKTLLSEHDVVVCTGGLGRTLGDHTRVVASELTQSPLSINELVRQDLRLRAEERRLSSLSDQAIIPESATPLLNPIGFAPGLMFKHQDAWLILLPGNPIEVQALFENQVYPRLRELTASKPRNRKSFYFCNLPESQLDPYLEKWSEELPDIHFMTYLKAGVLCLEMSGFNVQAQLNALSRRLVQVLGEYLLPKSATSLEEAILQQCQKARLSLGFAESCTGGQISARLANVPGAGSCLKGAIVCFSLSIKEQCLGVQSTTLERFGPVSEPSVREMVFGAHQALKSDISVAITGFAGPTGGTETAPLGTVYMAFLSPNHFEPEIIRCHFKGDRAAIMEMATHRALQKLYEIVKVNIGQTLFANA